MEPVGPPSRPSVQPDLFCGLEQAVGADHVGGYKRIRAMDRTVHMGFGGKINHGIQALFGQKGFDQSLIPDITVDKTKILQLQPVGQAGHIPRISQGIQHHHPVLRIAGQPVMDKIGPDKTGPAGYKQGPAMAG